MNNILLSIIIPTIKIDLINGLLKNLCLLINKSVEIIVINQTGYKLSIKDELVKDVMCTKRSASQARNYGAEQAKGDFLFFLDDDAEIIATQDSISQLLVYLRKGLSDIILFERGEYFDNKYISHWPNGNLTYKNFSRYVIEWNLLIKKDLFFINGKFDDIGTGSSNSAQSGEVFIFFIKLLSNKPNIILWPEIKIAHGLIYNKKQTFEKILGYEYGLIYAIGMMINTEQIQRRWKIYWFLRSIFNIVKTLFSYRDNLKICHKFLIIRAKVKALYSSIIFQQSNSLAYIKELTQKCNK